jgi:hypothetical protein
VPVEPVAVLPPASCTTPVEPEAEFVPPPPTATGFDAVAPPAGVAAPAAAPIVTAPDCAARDDPAESFPPPTCAAPSESDAVLLPPLPTVTGTLALAVVPLPPAEAEGVELTELT